MNNKRGISLIVLVITIVVVIILAAAVILSLSGNNPINNARVANLDQTKDGIESSILAYSGKAQSQTLGYYTVTELLTGNREETEEYCIIGDKETINNNDEEIYNIDKTKFESKIDTLPSTPTSNGEWYVDGNGKVYLVYDKKESMPKWMLNKSDNIDDTFLNKFVVITGENLSKVSAKEVANNASTYYGATVTNYAANGVDSWKVFHSDGTNIYLITTNFLEVSQIPATKKGNTFSIGSCPRSTNFYPAINDSTYSSGTGSIASDNSARKWLSFLNTQNSSYTNMRTVAYLLDTSVWNVYAADKAEYAIGAPTIEMFFDSYNKKYNKNYKSMVVNSYGYRVSKDGDSNYADYQDGILDVNDKLYVLPKSSESGANGMCIASPSVAYNDCIMFADVHGNVGYYGYYDSYNYGIRPIVCLNSNVTLKMNDDGSVTLK